jgi:hypothetical protein
MFSFVKEQSVINRTYLVCETCEQPITARVLIGHNPNPIYTFLCPHCSQEIKLGLEIDQEHRSFKYLYIANCRAGTSEGAIINLSAEIAISRENLHKDRFSAALSVNPDLFGTKRSPTPVIPKLMNNWKALRRAWSLTLEGKDRIAQRFLAQYKDMFDEESDLDLNSQIYNFTLFFVAPNRYAKTIPVFELIKNVQGTNLDQYVLFAKYWAAEYQRSYAGRYLDLITAFMKSFEAFYPILVYLRMGWELDPTKVSTSFDFDGTKMFYGDTFELLADVFIIPCCINNLSLGRPYSEFEKMDLQKYLTIDKANRASPFKSNSVLAFLCEEFDGQIRNASHHGNMRLSPGKDEVLYSHGKPPKEDRMTITEYLSSCCRAFMNALSILHVGLMLCEHARIHTNPTGA